MNPVTKSVLQSVLRSALTGLLLWLVSRKLLTQEQMSGIDVPQLAGELLALAGTVGWTVWQKIQDHIEKNTLAARAGTSIDEVKSDIARGLKAPANAPEHDVPVIGSADVSDQMSAFAAVARAPKHEHVEPPQRVAVLGVLAALTPWVQLFGEFLKNDNLTFSSLPDDLKTQRAIRNEKAADFFLGWLFKLGAKDPNDPKEPKE